MAVANNNEKGKSKAERISESSLRRLSVYYRTLNRMEKQDIQITTSMGLAEIEGISPAMVRKDLSFFGTFGCRGIGYDVHSLKTQLAEILGLSKKWSLVVIGGGQFGDVLINSQTLRDCNFTIKKIFEKDPDSSTNNDDQVNVYPIDQLEKYIDPQEDHIAIVALPPPEVQSIIDRLSKIGLKAVLYIASRAVKVPKNMVVMNQDISIKLGMMTYKVLEQHPDERPFHT
jgi:redox-sensing transcriptional repressor